ncbi:hypothetical protein PDO_3353 [Rhizobium sp. PDO1-076]|uniref:hypothetical protein n=1 Tax=Rhizobium sp. PDO1-076 TaxID=1125979 RepID=UPI00024E2BD0|nr:hypothetical protein [Rhizobium sp. PDO1-076]EHS49196.1 hypothetical protein PDO_3353 [Rhizobium sp. PDO1-076]
MTLVHFDTPIARSLRGAPAANRPAHLIVKAIAAINDWSTRRREQRTLESLPLDLRKDLGWPAGDMHR